MADKQPNFTEAQEARIREAAASGPEGKLNLALAETLATEMGKKPRSIIAKANRMGVPYARKQPTTKTGEPVVKKADLVTAIAELIDVNVSVLDGLEKAPKGALVAIRREAERLTAAA